MKNLIIALLVLPVIAFGQRYKYCELVGFEKPLTAKIIVTIDSGQPRSFWNPYDVIKEEETEQKAPVTKNEKVYVTTDQPMYEGKQVQSDAKGKYIWKTVTIEPAATATKTKWKNFSSMVDGLNYMNSLGWEFVQAYTAPAGERIIYRWLLKKKL